MNWKESIAIGSVILAVIGFVHAAGATGPKVLPQLSTESRACPECHKETSHARYEQWGQSLPYRAHVVCHQCP